MAFTYGDTLHPSAVISISSGKTYSYDANGNMLTGGNRTFAWDIDNRVSSVSVGGSTTSMFYDYSGTRVRKDGFGGISLYPFQGYEIDSNGVITKFIRVGGESIASKKGNNKYFYHNDHLGSVNVVTDSLGTRVQLNEYDPWGAVSRSEGSIDPDQRFTGQKLDPETGLYYYGGRYYDAEIGRFISADPFVQDPYDPQNLNRFSYVVNNPQNYIDPDGYFHIVKKKKTGGFFRIFAKIFQVILSIVTFQPELMALSIMNIAVAVSGLGREISDLTSSSGGTGPSGSGGLGGSGPPIPGATSISGGGFFSPALQLAMAAGCDVCSDPRFDLLRLMWGLIQPNEAHASDREGISFPPNPGLVHRFIGAMRRNTYIPSQKHGRVDRGQISRAPINGQDALDVSIKVSPNADRRVGIDYKNREFVVFGRTHENIYHGHVRPWEKLDQDMQNELVKWGLTDRRGGILD